MRSRPFELVRVDEVGAALEALSRGGEDARFLAGGQSLGPMLSYQLIEPTLLVDINGIAELSHITEDATNVKIGATVTEARVEHAPTIAAAAPLLAEASEWIAHPAVRERGTIGGSLAHNDPGGEYASVLVALDAAVRIGSLRGERTSDVASLVEGRFYETAIEPDEIILEISIPKRGPSTGHAFTEFAERKGDYAIAGAAAAVTVGGDGVVSDLRLCGIGGLYPMRLRAAERALVGQTVNDESIRAAAAAAAAEFPAGEDFHASEGYRRRLFETLAFRVLRTAARRSVAGN